MLSQVKYEQFRDSKKTCSIKEKISSAYKNVKKNRAYLATTVDFIFYLLKQGFSLRGHNEKKRFHK